MKTHLMGRVLRTLSLTLLIITSFAITSRIANAQTGAAAMGDKPTWPQKLTLGFGLAGNFNSPSSDSYTVDGITYSHGVMVFGPEFHLLLEVPIGTNLMFAPRLAYNNYSTQWDNGSPAASVSGIVDTKNLATSFSTIGVDLLFKYSFSNFHVMLGPQLSAPITSSYSHNTTYGTPGTTAMPTPSGLVATVTAGLGYDVPINAKNTIWITPEVFYDFFLTPLAKDATGGKAMISTFRIGASMKFQLSNDEPIVQYVPPTVSIIARGVLPDGSSSTEPVVPQQALHNRTSMPLLPYVFFANGESAIPSRYSKMGATGFTTNDLKDRSAQDANHALLDIIGMRMKEFPNAPIKITGTNSNSGIERNNINLSKARAVAVRDYLVNTWGISPSRITVDQRNLPELPTNPATKAGMEENRRVEFTSSDEHITGPVKIESRDNATVGETVVRFETSVTPSDYAFHDWTITLDQNGTPIGTPLSGQGGLPATKTMTIPAAASLVGQPIHYKLVANDAAGHQVMADGMTRVVNRTVDRENLEKYGMLSFDFNVADINPRAHLMLDLISESISRDANGVTVNGYCDSTGSAEYNQALSEQRANTAVTTLRGMTKLPANTNVQGYGLRDPKFDNTLPEGRQLNRRVEIVIEKSSK
ncbi:MAG: OmpA family protein [Candidatus Kapaibacterium sp.]|jgi:outer membrane protein OmpA-like peptidoglycan-associated protein